ncbi:MULTISPECIES: LysR substrate-binding domain-containing protein [unclassified Beijerinckia]|uniref:LysR substrate-binding domain-containing protein n=1 Tax=unclassified Beijerinckia TaxID=2638183 RepID=UPI000894C323|nr:MULTISPECIES: LysR substrate-binding domain-containing protein [unclassified Beijerinckia]MDH7799126.1 LysR family glycine cleavage system transcriptional activator [Beijerinckia sp. GAS462]SED94263.1 DNA-binding transcriptional regulator, LysR family [Beijerinckia sp. 28-YEA-48]
MHADRAPRFNLGTLRGFEAAARHLSFTLAAQELNVTQGAVSRQVMQLERDLGIALFQRRIRRLLLTTAGKDFYDATKTALRVLDEAATRLGADSDGARLTVSVLPTIGALWLMPKLHRFRKKHPKIDLRLISSIEPFSPGGNEIEIAIRVGQPPGRAMGQTTGVEGPRIDLTMATKWDGLSFIELMPDTLVPVISKSLIPSDHKLTLSEALSLFPRIHVSSRRHAWPDWLATQAINEPKCPDDVECGHFFMALDAMRDRQGIALVPALILANLEYRQELQILPFTPIASAGSYHAVFMRIHAANSAVTAFLSWLQEEATLLQTRTDEVLAQAVADQASPLRPPSANVYTKHSR